MIWSPIENMVIIFLLNTLLGSSWEGVDFPCSLIVGLRTKNYIFITRPFFVWKEGIFHETWTLKMYFLREIWTCFIFWDEYFHWWFENRPTCCFIEMMDDRKNKICQVIPNWLYLIPQTLEMT